MLASIAGLEQMEVATAQCNVKVAHCRIANAIAERGNPLTIIGRAIEVSRADAGERILTSQRECIAVVLRHGCCHARRRKIRIIQAVLVVEVHVRIAATRSGHRIANDRRAEWNKRTSMIRRSP